MDTKVSLLDGRELSIADVSDELAFGKELWTYSCDPLTGKIVPGLISWAGMTQESAKVMKLTLDNGESFICTPDHKFPVYEQEFKRADEFVVGDSFIPLYKRVQNIKDADKKDYEQYYDNASREWKYTHRMVADSLRDSVVKYEIYDHETSNGLYEVRHHKNFNRFDNDPTNLCWMSWNDHSKYHREYTGKKYELLRENNIEEYNAIMKRIGEGVTAHWNSLSGEEKAQRADQTANMWKNFTDDEYESICSKMSASSKKYIASLSPESRKIRDANGRAACVIAGKKFNEMMNSDQEFYDSVIAKRMEYWTEENREKQAANTHDWNLINWDGEKGTERKKKHSSLQKMEFSHDMLKFIIDKVKGKTTHEVTARDIANALNNSVLRDKLISLNKDKHIRNWKPEDGFTEGNIRRGLVTQFGYNNWKDFRVKESLHNHTVVSIEHLEERIPVGTLTIDANEIHHGFHTFALSCGIMTKNSNLSEIDDLRYFNNRLARGLRVPSSYLPTGPDDNTTPLSDGRVGTAMIQEFRFNQYCERLQNYIALKLDEEFKLFLRWRGFNIDTGLFSIMFNAPQNFAAYRQSELDNARVSTFASMEALPFISKRFAMERFLGLTEEEIKRNEKLWEEENREEMSDERSGSDLRNIGISTGDFEADQNTADNLEGMEEPPEDMPDVAGPVAGAPATGGASAAGASPGGPMQI